MITSFYEMEGKTPMNTDTRTRSVPDPRGTVRAVQGLPAAAQHQAEGLLPGLHPAGADR